MAETPRGGIRKETSVIVLELDSGDHIIVVSLSTRNDTQIIGVDPTTGALCFTGTQGLDVFASESDAGRYLKSRGMPSRPPIRAKAILGYAALGSMGLLLVATRVKASIPELPGGDTVHTVMESQWIKIPLSNSQFQSKFEAKNAADLTDIYIDTLHFYCETRDITRHFPSSEPVDNPDREFVWNLWLSAPFRKLGLQNHCVVLLQGFAEVRTFTEARDLPVTVAVTARRSRLHPGTRYLARGLNATFSTGNEVECEQLVWPARVTPGRPHPFSTYLWRRGTVPIWWGAEIKSTVAEAEIYVAETEPYLGSGKYYRRLARRYRNTLGKGGGKESDDQSSNPLIVCVNLLRNAAGKPETVLALRFEEAVNYVNSRNEVPDAKLCLMDYDWHAETKAIGEPSTVNGLWERLKTPTIAIGFGMGEYHPVPSDKSSSAVIPNKGSQGGYYTLSSKQDGVIRFNCADSLDRTNAASFFGAVQVLAEQCRRLGLPLDSSKYNTPSVLPNGRAGERDRDSSRGALGPLPPGWEMRSDAVTGQVFYIDHNTKTTTWNHPCPDEPWRRFVMTVEEFRDATLPSPIAAMAELFLIAGDIHATLYTGSKAMHSHIINIFSEEVGKGKRSAATNMAITLQRRFRNVLMDSTRQKQLEMFLGYRLYKYFPTLPGRPLQVLTRPQACLLNPIPNMFTSPNSPSFLLSNNFRDTAWICPAGGDSVQLLIYLAEPSHVCQILLTVAHGADDSTSPGSFDVSTGRTLKDIKLVLEGSKVPKCAHGTLLTYPLPGAMDPEEVAITGAGAGEQAYSWLYDFEEQEGEIDFLTRLVEIKFYPAAPGAPMTLGQVEVVGASLLWSSVLRDRDLPLIKASPSPKPPHLSEQTRSVTLPNIDLLSLESTSMTSSSFIDPAPMMTRTYSTPNTAACQVFDLLTGEFITEKPFPEQGSELSTFKNSNGRNNSESSQKSRNPESWDPFVTNSPATSVTNLPTSVRKSPEPSRPPSQAHPDAEVYLDLLKAVCGKIPSKSITFQEAMELEVARLLLGISAYGRDRALVSVGRDPATIDPNRLISTGAMAQVKQAASQLATIAEIDTEDKDLSSLGFDERRSEPDEVMENLHCLRIGCLSDMCQVTYAKGSGTFQYFEAVAKSSSFLGTCALCKRRVCAACHAGKGSALLYHNGPNPAGLGVGGNPKPARGPTAVDAIICKNCCPSSVRDYILLERVNSVLSARRRSRVNNACTVALEGLAGVQSTDDKGSSRASGYESFLEGEVSLAEFPQAGIISSVVSAEGSEPVHSLLLRQNEVSTACWRAPSGVDMVELTVVLNSLSVVSSIMFMTKLGGYTAKDAPMVDLWSGSLADEGARTYLGRFDVKAEISKPRSPRTLPPEYFRYKLRHAVTCRIIWIKFSLPSSSRSTNSSLVPGPPVVDLLSFDPPAAPAPSGPGLMINTSTDPSGSSTCIHAKRVIIIGQQIPEDLDTRFMSPIDKQSLKAFLDLPPQLSRLRVQVDMERARSGGRILEQSVNPQALNVAGFRLDAFAAVKNIAKYNPSWAEKSLVNRALGGAVDELITNLPTLRIRVSAIQETNQPVFVGDYLLPVARGGTPLYFDFRHPIMARGLIFEILGNISALTDEDPSQTDTEGKEFPLPNSLSLLNRIRIYRYALGSELGKWPQLNAV